jgi:hypothetical protein
MEEQRPEKEWLESRGLAVKWIVVVLVLTVATTITLAGVLAQPRRDPSVVNVPEGAVITGNRVMLKEGYSFVRQPGGTVAIARKKNPIVAGVIRCHCQKARNDYTPVVGTCTVSEHGESATCVPDGSAHQSCPAFCATSVEVKPSLGGGIQLQ